MKMLFKTPMIHWLIIIFFLFTIPAYGKDMRAASIKAKADYKTALTEEKESKERIIKGSKSLKKIITRIKIDVKRLNSDIKTMQNDFEKLKEEELKLALLWSDNEMDMLELAGTVRVVARDLETTLNQSQFTARFPERTDLLKPILNKNHFPGIDNLKTITDLFFQEMELSGEVVLQKGSFINHSGRSQTGDILSIGKFTGVYRTDKETGFLKYSEASSRFFSLSAMPSWSIQRNLKKYMLGKTDAVYLDFSGGAALRQITHKLTFVERIKNGGLIVWPILALGLLAFIIVVERTVFLKRVHANADLVMNTVNELALQGKWKKCEEIVKDKTGRPVYNVLKAGIYGRAEDRETQESILQEAILKELPRLERFLPALNIMGSIAPLLGLLGTVTGMISTFHVITLYGTGDPRMMSGGISEALVTTMFGLGVAIPIMLAHTFLNRRVSHIVGDMEEKAVALTNIVHREITVLE